VIEEAVEAIRSGQPVVLPTDTVYGLCTTPYHGDAVRRLARLKGRDEAQPIALLAASIDVLFDCVPELFGRSGRIIRAVLPGPYTLVLPNPARRYRWLSGARPDTIGVRVPELEGPAADVLGRVRAVAATSANLHGGPDPRALDEVPVELRDRVAVVLDGGELPGTASTAIDFTGDEPVVLRDGAVPAGEVLARVGEALRVVSSRRR
jgi:L-threonylcarbamoyladenylate synthase